MVTLRKTLGGKASGTRGLRSENHPFLLSVLPLSFRNNLLSTYYVRETLLDTMQITVTKTITGLPSGSLDSSEGERKTHQFNAR